MKTTFLANLFMCFLETQIIKTSPYMFKTWHRYVENIFAVIPNRHNQNALKLLNIPQFYLENKNRWSTTFFRFENYKKFQQPLLYKVNQHIQNVTYIQMVKTPSHNKMYF